MKYLNLSQDGTRFTLAVPDTLPLRAAACSIRGAHHEGTVDDLAVYSYPADPDTCDAILLTFDPDVDAAAARRVHELKEAQASLQNAMALKDGPAELQANPLLRTVPMGHQVQAFNFCVARAEAGALGTALLMEQGTGKSLVAVGLANHFWDVGRIRWVLVVCPNSVKGTWASEDGEILLHTDMEQMNPEVLALRGARPKRMAQLAKYMNGVRQGAQLYWVVVNWDMFAVNLRSRAKTGAPEVRAMLEMVKHAPPGMVVFDESSLAKNHLALRTKACMQLAALFPLRLILTGTPLTRAPLDLWSQFQLLQEGSLGFNSYMAYERAYALRQRKRARDKNGKPTHAYMQVVSYRNLGDLEKRVATCSFRALAKDCLDLPPVVVKHIPVELAPAQVKALRQLKDSMMAELDQGEYVDGRNILVRMGKMGEVCGGWVKALDDKGMKQEKPTAFRPNAKLDALRDYLTTVLEEDPARKVVVFVKHTAEVQGVVNMAAKWGAVPFDGTVPEKQRDEHRQRFSKDPDCRVFVAQYQCGSMGLNLTVADTIVFYSLTFSYGDHAQAQKRVHRKGQEAAVVNEVYLLARLPGRRKGTSVRSLDYTVLDALRDKRDLADIVTGDRARELMASD